MKRARVSEIWTYFDIESQENKTACCSICKQKLSFKATVSNLKKHLQMKHLITLSTVESKRVLALPSKLKNQPETVSHVATTSTVNLQQPSTSSWDIQQPSTSTNSSDISVTGALVQSKPPSVQSSLHSFIPKKLIVGQRIKIDEALMKLFTLDFQPFSIVEDIGFRRFVEVLNPSYQLPSRKHLSNAMLTFNYEKCLNEVREKTKNDIQSVCLTTDCWTSAAQESYIAVTAHYFDSEFHINSVLLECAPLPGSHNSINLAQELRRLIEEWNLTNKVLMVVADNATNIQNAIKDLHLKRFGCMAHTINLVAQHALDLESIKCVLGKVKSYVSLFKRSNLATEKLLRYQTQVGVTVPKRLLQDISTRWNSTYLMLERFVLLQDAIRATVGLYYQDKLDAFSTEEWQICKDLCIVLKPLLEVTKEMCGEKYVTGSIVIVFTRSLLTMYEKKLPFIPSIHHAVLDVAARIKNGILERLHQIEYSGSFSVCTFLDPRFKMFLFREKSAAEAAKKRVIELAVVEINQQNLRSPQIDEVIVPSTEPAPREEKNFSIWDDVDSIISEVQPVTSPQAKAIAEVQRYLADKVLPRKEQPSDWWQNHQHVYPVLSKVYRKYCCVLATSVPCERVFSKSGQLISDRRTRLGARKVQQLMFLNANSKLT